MRLPMFSFYACSLAAGRQDVIVILFDRSLLENILQMNSFCMDVLGFLEVVLEATLCVELLGFLSRTFARSFSLNRCAGCPRSSTENHSL